MREMVLLPALAVIGQPHAMGPERIEYPKRPIRVPPQWPGQHHRFAGPGFIHPRIRASGGKQIVVDNPTGASSTLGIEIGARAAPEGYTLLAVAAPCSPSRRMFTASSPTTHCVIAIPCRHFVLVQTAFCAYQAIGALVKLAGVKAE